MDMKKPAILYKTENKSHLFEKTIFWKYGFSQVPLPSWNCFYLGTAILILLIGFAIWTSYKTTSAQMPQQKSSESSSCFQLVKRIQF